MYKNLFLVKKKKRVMTIFPRDIKMNQLGVRSLFGCLCVYVSQEYAYNLVIFQLEKMFLQEDIEDSGGLKSLHQGQQGNCEPLFILFINTVFCQIMLIIISGVIILFPAQNSMRSSVVLSYFIFHHFSAGKTYKNKI